MLLKTHYAYKQGDTKHALREAFLAVDKQIVLEDTIDELQTLAGKLSNFYTNSQLLNYLS